jgi:hypothetical protein
MAQFVITAVPSVGINDDGTSLLIRATDGAGHDLDLVASATAFEEIVSALNEASNKAHDRRREKGLGDTGPARGDTELQSCLGFRYTVAGGRSHMVLQLQTATGRIDISLPATMAKDFRDATVRNAELLAARPRKAGH